MSDQIIPLLDIPTIDEEIWSSLDPIYADKLRDLLDLLKSTTDIYELRKIFDNFANIYLVLPRLWIYRKNLYSVYVLITICANREEFDRINKRAYCNFYSPQAYTAHRFTKYYFEMKRKVFDYKEYPYASYWDATGLPLINENVVYNDLSFPHENLSTVLKMHEAVGNQILSQKKYLECKKNIKCFEMLKIASSVEDYFNAYAEIGNNIVAIQSIEILLDKNACSKLLWKLYLQFLKNRLPRVYLDVFEKYTKFFISDMEMLEVFKQERERIYSTIPNLHEHKTLEDLLLTKLEFQNEAHSSNQNQQPHKFGNPFKSFTPQALAIPSPIIWYMLNHGTARQINLLFQTCKYLFLLKQTPICCNLILHRRFKRSPSPFYQQSFRIRNQIPNEMRKIFIVKTLMIIFVKPSYLLSSVIERISRCTIWYLYVINQNVSWKELQFLLESGNIERFVFMNGKITVDEGALVPVENIVEETPKAQIFITDSAAFTPKTFSRLAVFEKPVKFKDFKIKNVTRDFKWNDFNNFVTNHTESRSKFTIWFESRTKISFVKDMQNLSRAIMKEWKPKNFRPTVSIRISKK